MPRPSSKSNVCMILDFFQTASWIREQCANMSSRAGKGPAIRSYRRRKTALDLDLNRLPAGENREQEGPSTQAVPQEIQLEQQPQVTQPPMIDVEAIDDDVVECTPRAFAEVYLPLDMFCFYYFFNCYISLLEINLIFSFVFHLRLKTIQEEFVGGL